jgi:hypothetical protein
MQIKINIDPKNIPDSEKQQEQEEKPQAVISLNIRKSLDGNYIIRDHPLIDIIVMPEKLKVLALSKDSMGDRTYYAQNKLFDFMYKKGVIEPSSIQGGNIYSSMEASILKPKDQGIDPVQTTIFIVFKFLEHEMPIFAYEKQFDQLQDGSITEPDTQHSTELGEIPHKEKKGMLGQAIHSPQNAYNYMSFGE